MQNKSRIGHGYLVGGYNPGPQNGIHRHGVNRSTHDRYSAGRKEHSCDAAAYIKLTGRIINLWTGDKNAGWMQTCSNEADITKYEQLPVAITDEGKTSGGEGGRI